MDEKERQQLMSALSGIDRERELLERVASTRPPDYRHDLDDQLTALWAQRVEIAERLRPSKPRQKKIPPEEISRRNEFRVLASAR